MLTFFYQLINNVKIVSAPKYEDVSSGSAQELQQNVQELVLQAREGSAEVERSSERQAPDSARHPLVELAAAVLQVDCAHSCVDPADVVEPLPSFAESFLHLRRPFGDRSRDAEVGRSCAGLGGAVLHV